MDSNYSVWHLHCISQIVQMETSTLGQMFSHSCFMEVCNVQWSVSAQFALNWDWYLIMLLKCFGQVFFLFLQVGEWLNSMMLCHYAVDPEFFGLGLVGKDVDQLNTLNSLAKTIY